MKGDHFTRLLNDSEAEEKGSARIFKVRCESNLQWAPYIYIISYENK